MSINRAKALKSAQKYLAKGQIDRAITEYQKVVEDDPKDARSLLKLGDLLTRTGDNRGAANAYRKVAEQYATQGFFLKAVAVCKQILKLDNTDLAAWEKLAEMYELLSLASDALATYEQVADAHLNAGRTREALNALGKMAELDPENVAATIRYAEALSKTDRIEEATEAFRRGADLLKQQGRMEDYLKVSERLLFHDNDDFARVREVAAMYIERGNAKSALAHLQAVFKANPRDAATLELLAQAFKVLGQLKKAASVYKELARVHGEAQRPAEEAHALRQLLELSPDDRAARARFSELGDVDSQDEDDVEIVEDDEIDEVIIVEEGSGLVASPPGSSAPPPGPEAQEEQVERLLTECEVFVRYGLRDKVIAQLDKVLDLDAGNLRAREMLKQAFLQAGQTEDAVTQLFLMSETLAESDPSRARTYLREAAQLAPHDEAVSMRLRELEQIGQSAPTAGVAALDDEDDEEDELIILDDEEDDETSFSGLAASEPAEASGDEASFASLLSDPAPRSGPEPQQPAIEAAFEEEDDDEPELVLEDSDETIESLELTEEDMLDSGSIQAPQVSVPPPLPGPRPNASQAVTPEPEPRLQRDTQPEHEYQYGDEDAHEPVLEAEDEDAHEPVLEDENEDELPEAVADALEEADFYLAQQLYDEAREVLLEALGDHPNHPAVMGKLRAIDTAEEAGEESAPDGPDGSETSPPPAPKPAAADGEPEEDRSFALAQKLADQVVDPAGRNSPVGVDEVLQQFKQGVKNNVAPSDVATHYDLGIAYMEMGLHSEAIEEFELCLESSEKQCTAHTMIGLSYVSKGEMQNAIEHFRKALASPGITPDEEIDLWFEIGNAYELLGKASEALIWYEKVEEQNSEFRDVSARIERLGVIKSEQEEVDEFDEMFDNMILKD